MSAGRLHARLARVAAEMRACAIHGGPLVCVCDCTWTGTAAEWDELARLTERLRPYRAPYPRAAQVCPRCETGLWCAACEARDARPVTIPADVLAPEEWQRERELMRLVRIAPPGTEDQATVRGWPLLQGRPPGATWRPRDA
jgi:hypothetical protein